MDKMTEVVLEEIVLALRDEFVGKVHREGRTIEICLLGGQRYVLEMQTEQRRRRTPCAPLFFAGAFDGFVTE